MSKAIAEFLFVGLIGGTLMAIVRYLAVWYFMRRIRHVLRRRKNEPTAASRKASPEGADLHRQGTARHDSPAGEKAAGG